MRLGCRVCCWWSSAGRSMPHIIRATPDNLASSVAAPGSGLPCKRTSAGRLLSRRRAGVRCRGVAGDGLLVRWRAWSAASAPPMIAIRPGRSWMPVGLGSPRAVRGRAVVCRSTPLPCTGVISSPTSQRQRKLRRGQKPRRSGDDGRGGLSVQSWAVREEPGSPPNLLSLRHWRGRTAGGGGAVGKGSAFVRSGDGVVAETLAGAARGGGNGCTAPDQRDQARRPLMSEACRAVLG